MVTLPWEHRTLPGPVPRAEVFLYPKRLAVSAREIAPGPSLVISMSPTGVHTRTHQKRRRGRGGTSTPMRNPNYDKTGHIDLPIRIRGDTLTGEYIATSVLVSGRYFRDGTAL